MIRATLAAVAGWFASLAIDFIGHGVLLAQYWRATASYWRPASDLLRMIPVGYLSMALYCGALTWLLMRLHPRDIGVKAGFRLGAIAGLTFGACSMLGTFSVLPVPFSLVIVGTGLTAVQSMCSGVAIGWVLDAEKPARRMLYVFLIAIAVVGTGIAAQNLRR